MKDLPIRTLIAVLLIGLLALVLWLGGWVQAIVLGLISVIAVYEMHEIFAKKDIHPFVIPQAVLALTMYAAMYKLGMRYVLLLAVIAFTAIMIERILNKKRTTLDAVAGMFILIYPLAMLGCLGLIGFGRNDLSRIALFCCFAGPCMADNTAYMLGSTFGKHKLCPAISPNKTVEGAIGGVVGGALGGVIAYFVQKLWGLDVSLIMLVSLCFICGIVGQFGDLFSSTFKRWAGVKDYGNIFPGHGGVMDRLDSAMVSAPIIAVVFMLFVR
ncbi:MAG: phosphatidate cytidylyltransferase [Christensenellaceae bacterium]|nr:phosphatidate cytidylyltransferase [Christensenellaceae bacterium]